MRVVSWNLHGADIPGRASNDQQQRAWDYMRQLGADLMLAQEASATALPRWLWDDWTVVAGERGRFRKNWNWGSVIAAKGELGLAQHQESLTDPWLAQLYDLVLLGKVRFGSEQFIVASVHTAAMPVRDWLRDHAVSLNLSESELRQLRRPECDEAPFLNDLAFTALARTIGDQQFLIAGDWNTCRKYPGGPEFFARAESRGWIECHGKLERQSFFGKGVGTYQLDHAFVDASTARAGVKCQVHVNDTVRELSDHAPIVVDVAIV